MINKGQAHAPHLFGFYGRPFNPIWSAILWPLNHIFWALILTVILFICINNGRQSILKQLLSWPAIRPLSRIIYSVYLTHFLVIYIDHRSRRNLIEILYHCVSILTISYIVGFIFTILFETPINNLMNIAKRKLLPTDLKSPIVNDFKLINSHSTNNYH
ncbi:hypothetical protein HUG17_9043 [Dermatophagoides farinae]|uniref:Acyltransferase 3 domain-containing protein n=1 Tax=Dermatophagoides farinae TaxID=6954 RepID=A0A9D4NTG4_DERFA|nr:hypothetical protein HUG17_9043 [Dermatophagoides farinae]